MPTHLGHEAISAKLGHADPSIYLGHEQIYPNSTTVTSFAFADTSTVSNAGETRVLNIGGDIGSTITLTGSNGASSLGAQTLSSTSSAFNIPISANNSYGASSRTPTVTLGATGNTSLAGGLPTTRTLTQAAGPAITNISISTTTSVFTLVNNTTTVNGQLRWASGASFRVIHSINLSGAAIPWNFLSTVNSCQVKAVAYGNTGSLTATQSGHSVGGDTNHNYYNNLFWYMSNRNGSLPAGNIPPNLFNAQYDITLTNSANPSFIQFNILWVPSMAYNLNGAGQGLAVQTSGVNWYP